MMVDSNFSICPKMCISLLMGKYWPHWITEYEIDAIASVAE
jgi:hypothetical protein